MNFGENLRSLRMTKNLKQAALAEQLNVSAKTISHWENGYTEPSIAQLIMLARFFDVSIDDLVGNI